MYNHIVKIKVDNFYLKKFLKLSDMELSSHLHSLKNHNIVIWKIYSDAFLDREKLTIKILEKIDIPETHFKIESVTTKLIRSEEEK